MKIILTETELDSVLDALNYAIEYCVQAVETCPYSEEKKYREKIAEIDDLMDALYSKKKLSEKC